MIRPDDPLFFALAELLGNRLRQQGLQLVVAESCTGGGLAYALTEVPGSSDWFERGFVCYSNAAKIDMLGVSDKSLATHGAVSETVALEMANGALQHSRGDLAIAVTGIAGPGGGSAQKPVGTVYIAWQQKRRPGQCTRLHIVGNRQAVRRQVIEWCLKRCLALLPDQTDF